MDINLVNGESNSGEMSENSSSQLKLKPSSSHNAKFSLLPIKSKSKLLIKSKEAKNLNKSSIFEEEAYREGIFFCSIVIFLIIIVSLTYMPA